MAEKPHSETVRLARKLPHWRNETARINDGTEGDLEEVEPEE